MKVAIVGASGKTGTKLVRESLERGYFYSSTGVPIDAVIVTAQRVEVHIGADRDFRYTTTFIGAEGRVLSSTEANPAVYDMEGDPGYVRARVENSRGDIAWLQPIFTISRQQ